MKSAGLEAGGNDGQVIASYNFFGGVFFVLCYLLLPQHTSCQVTGIVIKHRRTAAMYITSPRDEILKIGMRNEVVNNFFISCAVPSLASNASGKQTYGIDAYPNFGFISLRNK